MFYIYVVLFLFFSFFFFNDPATTEIYTLSLHDALPISSGGDARRPHIEVEAVFAHRLAPVEWRSEEHTSGLQSHHDLVCRLLLEKKKKKNKKKQPHHQNNTLHLQHHTPTHHHQSTPSTF